MANPPTISSPVSTYPSFSTAYSSWCLSYWSAVLGPKWGLSADGFICQSGCPLIEAVSCVIRFSSRAREAPLNIAPATEHITVTYLHFKPAVHKLSPAFGHRRSHCPGVRHCVISNVDSECCFLLTSVFTFGSSHSSGGKKRYWDLF